MLSKIMWTVFSFDLDSQEMYTDYVEAVSATAAAEHIYKRVAKVRGETAPVQVVAVVRGHHENLLY